jgi:hypothetical protein
MNGIMEDKIIFDTKTLKIKEIILQGKKKKKPTTYFFLFT